MTSQALNELPDPTTIPTAGFLPRLAAAIIDAVVLGPLSFGIYYFMVWQPSLLGIVAVWLISFAYKPILEARLGFTIGKWIMRLRVVDRGTNLRIDFNQSLLRYLPWAISAFVTLFVYIRLAQSAGIQEVGDLWAYNKYMNTFPLSQNFFVSMGNSFPIFSAVWLISDPWHRALHDRWAETFVVRDVSVRG
ncbi:putative RDD family membrane protein YckC [Neolewinella xylanilytica]|uniref:Putative RDD family membrane protein YckC n=1 Tax=Neolewinella xylanilytica TaxID=1514080 RepID=A0A2S6I5I0_9BACT|nr:RDD family protein [Neolewinella xylanilytica]PPK86389.1 putative RDD family membrane protein YckC [Neolewinella xylanilytica]